MASGTPGGNWKHTSANKPPAAAGAANTGKSRRPWQPGAPANKPPTGQRKSRFGRFLFAGLATGVLCSLIAIVVWWFWPARYPSLVVVGPNPGGAALAVPENTGGANAAADLARWAGDGKNRPRAAGDNQPAADKDAWRGKLDRNARSVFLYFTAQGGADAAGPFLWFVPAGAARPTDDHKLHVKDILTHLAGHPKEQKKLVVFDAARLPASWAHGMVFNDFNKALKELDPKIAEVPNLVVICSADEDQRAWDSEEWKSSVFGHFLFEGLKGATGGDPGSRITVANLFDYVSREVPRWSGANRDEKQTPILLPVADGKARASEFELAAISPDGYDPKHAWKVPEPPGKLPDDLTAAWRLAEQLADRVPSPDSLDPVRWRLYLDLLVRWERLVRMGGEPKDVRDHATQIGKQLETITGLGNPQCLTVAVPVGPALGLEPAPRDAKEFKKLWDPPPPGVTRGDVWGKWPRPHDRTGQPFSTAALRVAVADLVVTRLLADGLSPANLATAEEVFQAVDGTVPGTAEGHFVRMLKRHLADPAGPGEPPTRPGEEELKDSLRLRREAEEIAWLGGADPRKEYPYAEQVNRWIEKRVEDGDAARRPGEDLLFGTTPQRWEEAKEVHFKKAREHYKQAKADATVVAAALAARDKVSSRLPYYARWLAAYRGNIPAARVEELLKSAEVAARAGHRIAKLTAVVPADPVQVIAELKAETDKANANYDAVVKAFNDEVVALGNDPFPSTWHALDNALSVPFLRTDDRVKLVGYVRSVSHTLAATSEQPRTPGAAPPPAADLARRQSRMALAVLGDDAASPPTEDWRQASRATGDRVGKRFQGLADEVRSATNQVAITPKFRDAGPSLAEAARLARLIDPAASLPQDDGPVVAERRFWQYRLLLGQARRTVADGWAHVDSTPAVHSWYCLKSAKLSIDTARELARGPEKELPPSELERRLEDVIAAETLRPVELKTSPGGKRAICDEPRWDYPFTIARGPNERVGFPVYQVQAPPPAFGVAKKEELGRRVEDSLGKEQSITRQVRFTGASLLNKKDPGQVSAEVLYRGQWYRTETQLQPAGTATRIVAYDPPKGDAAFYVIADRGAVAGVVTILIDRSLSMKDTPAGATRNKFQQVYDAVDALLDVNSPDGLPAGTTLTIVGFWGDANFLTYVEPAPGVVRVLWRGDPEQRKQILAAVGEMSPHPNGRSTPLAKAIVRVLSKEERKSFWPENIAGVRTLIALSDGAENSNDRNPGNTVRDALLGSGVDEDTALHLLFFALDKNERVKAQDQFGILSDLNTRADFRRAGRTAPDVSSDAANTAGLVEKFRRAMLPRIKYEKREGTNLQSGLLLATLPGGKEYWPSPPLAPGAYHLTNLRVPQVLRLDPADRVVLRSRRKGDQFELVTPPLAFELASLPTTGWPRGEAPGVRMTLPRVVADRRPGAIDLDVTATLESTSIGQLGNELRQVRPALAWFDMSYADGKPADPNLRPILRTSNRPLLVAPAWNLWVTRWDHNRDASGKADRKPTVTGFWIDTYPANPAGGRFPADLTKEDDRPVPGVSVDGQNVEVVSVGTETELVGNPERLPPGKYLVVRLAYPDATKPVFVRPGNLKGTQQKFALHERHFYYEDVGRYTARFGPIEPGDETRVDLEVHSVTGLKAEADRLGGKVIVRYEDDRPLGIDHIPTKLTPQPYKE